MPPFFSIPPQNASTNQKKISTLLALAVAARPNESLSTVPSEQPQLTGTKAVCEMGNCGACTLVLDHHAVYSCLVLAAECEGSRETIESLAAAAELAPLQQAFVDCDGLQCGFCTSGQIMSLEGLRRTGRPVERVDVIDAVTGNLCRCGSYEHIIEAGMSNVGLNGSAGDRS